ncbi:GntR family transcriptional regulator [Falsigemmobacter faecalis]|uniref:GntR family transcriptional regulator n=1 Tax=Falsigemmobacter faecalis TaxID=2488730 RepID=A0A3P3DFG0_9RHOB|nr:GntR family transcriptional regulator [Falsigemmobacter faecalis]RRH72396.1 GntR family transcriptional regulator [Falsigemmobacter faecalis]
MVKADPASKAREPMASRIVRELTEAILTGRLGSGARLEETLIAEHFGASRTPVREALRELSALGLVEMAPHRGASVARIDDEVLLDRFEAMAELEAVAGRLAALRITPEAAQGLIAEVEAAASLVEADDREGFRAHNRAFHNAIYEATGNQTLIRAIRQVRMSVAVFRARQFDLARRLESSHAEHREIAAAIAAGDAVKAADLLRHHLLIVRKAAAQHLRQTRIAPL